MLQLPSSLACARLTQKSAIPASTGQAALASHRLSPVVSQCCQNASAMSAPTWTSHLPVLQQLGVSSEPVSALSHGKRAPSYLVHLALARAASRRSTRYCRMRRAIFGAVASSGGYIHVSLSQKTCPL